MGNIGQNGGMVVASLGSRARCGSELVVSQSLMVHKSGSRILEPHGISFLVEFLEIQQKISNQNLGTQTSKGWSCKQKILLLLFSSLVTKNWMKSQNVQYHMTILTEHSFFTATREYRNQKPTSAHFAAIIDQEDTASLACLYVCAWHIHKENCCNR